MAIDVSHKLNRELCIVGSIGYSHLDYFNEKLSLVDNSISLIENIYEKTGISKLYGRSKLLLSPINMKNRLDWL